MKKRYVPYILCTLVIFGILTTLTFYTMDTFPMRQTAEKPYPSVKIAPKKCKCCSKQMTRIKEQIRTAQQRKNADPRPQADASL